MADVRAAAVGVGYRSIVRPVLFRVGKGDAETAHRATLERLRRLGERPRALAALRAALPPVCSPVTVAGIEFPNRVGLAAGVDKDGVAARAWGSLGFGHVELGTVTAQAQPGNDPPRLFRLRRSNAIINRMGFNNSGATTLAARLREAGPLGIPVGVSIGKTKVTPVEDAVEDYLSSLRDLDGLADYIAVNVSSPNTPGLRSLQEKEPLAELLASLVNTAAELARAREPRVPEASPAGPEASPMGPEASRIAPEASPMGPEASRIAPEASPMGPEASHAGSEASPMGREGSHAGSEASPIGREASPAVDEGSGAEPVVVGPPSGVPARAVPIFVKIDPDLSNGAIDDVLEVAQHADVSGIIATNTTLGRSGLHDRDLHLASQPGGLSGAPLTLRAREVVGYVARHTQLPVIGVGGVMSADDGLALLDAGASLVQVYTGYIYRGPALVHELARALA